MKQDFTLQILNLVDHLLKKLISLKGDELGEPIINEFAGLRAKTNSYLKENNDEDKKGTKKCHKKKT